MTVWHNLRGITREYNPKYRASGVERALPVLFLIGPIAIQLSGCGPQRTGQSVHLILATDDSGGCSNYLPSFASLGSQLVARLDPDKDFLTAYRMEHVTHCYYDDRAPESPDDFEETMIHALSPKPSEPGTFSAECWTTVYQVSKKQDRDLEIVIETDGDDDQNTAESRQAIRAAAIALSQNRHVRAVAVVGVAQENWQTLADELAPLGGRLRIFGRKQVSADTVGHFLDSALKEDRHGNG